MVSELSQHNSNMEYLLAEARSRLARAQQSLDDEVYSRELLERELIHRLRGLAQALRALVAAKTPADRCAQRQVDSLAAVPCGG
jgi:hypothetical protein